MTLVKRHLSLLLLAAGFLLGASSYGWAKFEKEQIALENQLTQRINDILSKTLPPNSYLVTVKVEMSESGGGVNRRVNTRGGENPFLQKNRFVLPGVPEKKQFNSTPEVTEESTTNVPVEALVKKMTISILVAPDVTAEQIRSLREFISSSIPFNPLRGDELDIRPSTLIRPVNPTPAAVIGGTGAGEGDSSTATDNAWTRFAASGSLPLMIMLGAVVLGLFALAAFLFGPVRAFFNRLLAVLPRVGEQAVYAANNNGNNAAAAAAVAAPVAPQYSGGGNNNDTGPKLNMPFQFIREEQLGKLALLFRELSSSEAALILAYLPPAWASKMLTNLDSSTQAAITRELSRSREVPAEVVNQVEAQIREKLPYMVGGMEWIQSVFPMTPPQTQRVLLSTLAQDSPDAAKALRSKTFFFEDLGTLTAPALRILVQELSYPIMALALHDEKKDMQDSVMRRLPAGIREIIQQELELSKGDKPAMADAKNRLVVTARRLLAEGRITLGAA